MLRSLSTRLLLCLLLLLGGAARAGEEPFAIEQFNARLDRAHATLQDAEKTLAEPAATALALKHFRDKVDLVQRDLEDLIEQLTPRLDAVKARLDELGEAPEAASAPEQSPAAQKPAPSPAAGSQQEKTKPGAKAAQMPAAPVDASAIAEASVSAKRAEQQKLFDGLDAASKRARSLLVEAKQTALATRARQRALFAQTVLLRSSSLFSPALWSAATRELPADARAARDFLADASASFTSRLESQAAAFLALSGLVLLAVVTASVLARRLLAHGVDASPASPLQKAARAAWTALALALLPLAACGGLLAVVANLDLLDASFEPLGLASLEAIARIALAYALTRALLAPRLGEWRLIAVDDRFASLIERFVAAVAVAVSATRILEQLEESSQAGLSAVIVTRGMGALFVALLLALALLSMSRAKREEERSATPPVRDLAGLPRLAGWAAVAVIAGACAIGYVTFASFVINEAVWIATVWAVLYLLLKLSRAAVEEALEHRAPLGRGLVTALGVRRESLDQLAVLLADASALLLYAVAAFVILVPLGLQSNDFLSTLHQAFLGFKVGDVVISPSSAVTALAIFGSTLAASRGLRRWLDLRYLPLTRLDMGLRNSIGTSLSYAGFILAASLALAHLGVGLEKLALVAGALSVGIGFGLQSIVGNFVSGLIILWERAIRVGDWVVVGDEQGYVKRINVRSTEIETFDRATMIVPNSSLASGAVKNWLRNDRVGRIKIALSPHSSVDPETIRAILLAAAKAQEGVLRVPPPQVMFLGMEPQAFRFELWCFVEDVEQATRVRSDLHFDLYRRLSEAGVSIGPPPAQPATTIVTLSGLDKAVAPDLHAAERAYQD